MPPTPESLVASIDPLKKTVPDSVSSSNPVAVSVIAPALSSPETSSSAVSRIRIRPWFAVIAILLPGFCGSLGSGSGTGVDSTRPAISINAFALTLPSVTATVTCPLVVSVSAAPCMKNPMASLSAAESATPSTLIVRALPPRSRVSPPRSASSTRPVALISISP